MIVGGNKLAHMSDGSIVITNFEVIKTTGPNEGPRSAGAPVANAGLIKLWAWASRCHCRAL